MLPNSGASQSHVTRFWLEVTPRDSPGRVRPVPAPSQAETPPALSPEPAQAAVSAGRAWETAGRPPPGHTFPHPHRGIHKVTAASCGMWPRPPQGHGLAADQQLPSRDSQHARRGREHALHRRRPPAPRLGEAGAGGAWPTHLPLPRPALSSAHRTAFARWPVCSPPPPL